MPLRSSKNPRNGLESQLNFVNRIGNMRLYEDNKPVVESEHKEPLKREVKRARFKFSISPFVGTFMPEEQRNASGAYQGAKYFSYNGKVLDEIRKEKENME